MIRKSILTEKNFGIYCIFLKYSRSVFKYFDVDNSNEITSDNLKEAMMRYGKNLSEAEVEEMIAAHDLTKNKRLNFEEFKEMMLQENKIEKISLPDENFKENDDDEEEEFDEE